LVDTLFWLAEEYILVLKLTGQNIFTLNVNYNEVPNYLVNKEAVTIEEETSSFLLRKGADILTLNKIIR
jgi:ribosome biogenesis SPOUT family RNA methylase Rps3